MQIADRARAARSLPPESAGGREIALSLLVLGSRCLISVSTAFSVSIACVNSNFPMYSKYQLNVGSLVSPVPLSALQCIPIRSYMHMPTLKNINAQVARQCSWLTLLRISAFIPFSSHDSILFLPAAAVAASIIMSAAIICPFICRPFSALPRARKLSFIIRHKTFSCEVHHSVGPI